MPGLEPKILIDGVWTSIDVRQVDTGSPLVSVSVYSKSRLIPDVYTLIFSNVIPGVSADILISTESTANPYTGQSTSVILDGMTIYDFIIPGCNLVFSDDAEFLNSWTSELTLGLPFGVLNAFAPSAGVPVELMIQVENTGDAAGSSCIAKLMTELKAVIKTGIIFSDLRPASSAAVAKLSSNIVSPYLFEASNVLGSGPAKTLDLDIDGSSFSVLNLSSNIETSSVNLTVVDYYRVMDGDLAGSEFKLSEDTNNGDQENVLAFEPTFVELAINDNGAPGAWATDDVLLTEDGQSNGIITAAGVAYFFMRVTVSEFGSILSNPYPCCVVLEGSALQAANWST